MKKNDLVLIIMVLLFSGIAYLCFHMFSEDGEQIVISVDGIEYGIYKLNENQYIYINDTNVLVIEDGEAYMLEANCPDGLCLSQSAIHQNNESIICLPNRVIVEVENSVESEYDVISQ